MFIMLARASLIMSDWLAWEVYILKSHPLVLHKAGQVPYILEPSQLTNLPVDRFCSIWF